MIDPLIMMMMMS